MSACPVILEPGKERGGKEPVLCWLSPVVPACLPHYLWSEGEILMTEMSEARDTAGLLAGQPPPGTKRSLSYTETEDHQFSTEGPSPKLYRAGLNTVRP